MKSFTSIVLVAVALAASFTVDATSLDKRQTQTISQAWCKEHTKGCQLASRETCGSAPSFTWNAKCEASFTNNVCTAMRATCACTPLNGSAQDVSAAALQKTFVATTGTCSNVPVPSDGSMPTLPSASGVPAPAASGAGATPSGTGSGPSPSKAADIPKSDASSIKIASAALTVAVSVGLAVMNL